VTDLRPTAERNIAQVFQFPVVYDTMTVRENLAFPLINRGYPRMRSSSASRHDRQDDRPTRLDRRARGLTADEKQKISLGRGWCARTSTRSCSTSR
jgi:glycerol transport system ATP-binding protein